MSLSKEIGIDLGTANILIYLKGEGIVVNEPSVVTINTETNKPVAVGAEARDMLGKTPGRLKAIRPLKDGVIADFQTTEILITHFINKLNLKGLFSRHIILICCPTNVTAIEKSALQDVALRCGAKRVYIEEEPKVAAIGAGLDISKPSGNMVVDIGGGTTDVAVLSLGEIVTSQQLKMAGNRMDEEIVKYVKDKYKLLIGDSTAEHVKIQIGCAFDGDPERKVDCRGRDMVTGLPKTIQISEAEVEEALHKVCEAILLSAKQVLEQTPPELSADIVNKGVFLTGGGALLHNLDKYMEQGLKVPVFVADEPLNCVAEGCGVMLENTNYLE